MTGNVRTLQPCRPGAVIHDDHARDILEGACGDVINGGGFIVCGNHGGEFRRKPDSCHGSIDRNNLTRDIGGGIRHQVGDETCNFRRCAGALHRDQASDRFCIKKLIGRRRWRSAREPRH